MNRYLLYAYVFIIILSFNITCTKEAMDAEAKVAVRTSIFETPVSYKDNFISIVNFKAKEGSNGIAIDFTTLYKKNVASLEVLRGYNAINLCSIYKTEGGTDSNMATLYVATDEFYNKAPAVFYMIKYTLADGNWGYTPIFKLGL